MHSRRAFIAGAAGSIAAMGLTPALADDGCAVFTPDSQKATSPEAALQMLKDGNKRFVSGKMLNCNLMEQVKATASGQAPIAAIVGCIDSRVPPEMVFDQQIGDIFAARIAGNFVNDDIIGSLEFATAVAGAKVIVVLGHTECGAVKGAIDKAELGLLTKMLQKFQPAISMHDDVEGEKTSKNRDYVRKVTDTNAKLAVKDLTDRSSVLKGLVDEKKLIITSAVHDVGTGAVTFL